MGAANKEDINLEDTLRGMTLESSSNYPASEVYYLSFEGQEYGPLWINDIKNNINPEGLEMRLRSMQSENWVAIHEHPLFQRRRMQVAPEQEAELNEEITELYLLKDGEKTGPYTVSKLKAFLKRGDVLFTDMVSISGTNNWKKLYEINNFDRRSSELPISPEKSIFEQSQAEVNTKLDYAKRYDTETEAIAGLAYIGNIKTGKSQDKKMDHSQSEQSKKTNHPQAQDTPQIDLIEEERPKNNLLWGLVFIVSLGGLIYLYLNPIQKTKKAKRTKTKTSKVSKAKKSKPKIIRKVAKGSARVKREAPKPRAKTKSRVTDGRVRSRGETSFKNSKAFQKARSKREMRDDALIEQEADEIFDNADEAVEHDPIRSRLSKETIDPEDIGENESEDLIEEEFGNEDY